MNRFNSRNEVPVDLIEALASKMRDVYCFRLIIEDFGALRRGNCNLWFELGVCILIAGIEAERGVW